MNDKNKMICALLTKDKSDISSISFSSDDEEKKAKHLHPALQRVHNMQTSHPWRTSESLWNEQQSTKSMYIESLDSSKGTNASLSARNLESKLSFCELNDIKPSTTIQGKLVARVLPHQYSDYDTQKSMARIDPAHWISCLSTWQNIHGSDYNKNPHSFIGLQKSETPPSKDDASSVIALDLYLMRSEFLQDQKSYTDFQLDNCDKTRENLIQTLMNSVDLSRNNSSHIGFTAQSSPDRSNVLKDNVFHLHMNRSSNETALRTLRRLELSFARKLKEMHPGSIIKEKLNSLENEQAFCKLIDVDGDLLSNQAVDELGEGGDDQQGYRFCREIDISEMSSAEMWNVCAKRKDKNLRVALVLPSAGVWTRGTKTINSQCAPRLSALEYVRLDIISNPPTLISIKTFENFTAHLFTGVPIALQTTILYSTYAFITWFADDEVVMEDSNVYTPTMNDVGKRLSVLVTPIRPDHDGEGCQEAYSFKRLIEPLPQMPIVELRQNWIHMTGDISLYGEENRRIRVLTYNILADLYAGREIDQQFMYSHCEPQHLLRRRRMPMVIAEILAYNADIICLQEVDASIHDSLLSPVLTACGYQGFYSDKVTAQQEGCSMFWSTTTFELTPNEDMMAFPLRELLTRESNVEARSSSPIHTTQYYDARSDLSELELERWESMHGINNLLESHDEVRKVYKESVGQIVQMARLSPKQTSSDGETKQPKHVVVSNTHLFYHPMADHIRLLQAYAICHKLDEVRRVGGNADPLIICGDFNSGPLSGAVRLLTQRSLSPNESECWKNLNVYTWECGNSEYMLGHGYIGNTPRNMINGDPLFLEKEFVDAYDDMACLNDSYFSDDDDDIIRPPTIVLPTCFPDFVSGCTTVPVFTNYAVDFVETLDYIFASKPSDREIFGFKPLGEAPMPTEEMVKHFVAMPNEFMPSDHLAIVCDFEWVGYLNKT